MSSRKFFSLIRIFFLCRQNTIHFLTLFVISAAWTVSNNAFGCSFNTDSYGQINYIGVGEVPPGYRHVANPHWVKDFDGKGYSRILYVKTFFYSSTGSEVVTYPTGKNAFSFSTKQKTIMNINPGPCNSDKSHSTGRVDLHLSFDQILSDVVTITLDDSSGHKQIKLTLIAGERENTYLSCSDKTTFDFNFSNDQVIKPFCDTYISQTVLSRSVKHIDDLIDISIDFALNESHKIKKPNIVYTLKRKEVYSAEFLWNKDLTPETSEITPQANSSTTALPTFTNNSMPSEYDNAQILIKNNKGQVITTFNIHHFSPNKLRLLEGNEKLLTYQLHNNKATRLNTIHSKHLSDWRYAGAAQNYYPIISLIMTAVGFSFWGQSY